MINKIITEAKEKAQWVDIARFLAAFLVVLAHVNGWGSQSNLPISFYYIISRAGVPIFFLISGFLLLSKDDELFTFLKKRISKILIPFLIWSIVYDVIQSQPFDQTGVTLQSAASMIIRIIRGPRAGHLWFLYHLIGLYLLVPILRVFVKHTHTLGLYYYITLWVFVMSILPIIEEFTPIQNGFEIYSTGGYVGYFLLGYYIGNMENSKKLLHWGVGLFLSGFISSFVIFYFNVPPYDNELIFRSYPSLNIILMSLGAFILMRIFGEKSPSSIGEISNRVGRLSFGIYLIHMLILASMQIAWKRLGFEPQSGNPWIVIPLVALVAFSISWIFSYVISKIPVIQKII